MIRNILERNLIPPGDYIYGFADLGNLVNDKYGDFRFGISIGKRLDDRIIDGLNDGPTLEYFDHYRKVNNELAGLTARIEADLTHSGIESIRVPPTVSLSRDTQYLETLTYEISHKMVATRAGLGWIGKSDLFISPLFGPRLRLVSILLRQNPGVAATPVERSRCGKCKICVERCPAGASNGKPWNTGIHRDEFFDAFRCREKCGELARTKLKSNEHICGMCVFVCPVGSARKKEYMQTCR